MKKQDYTENAKYGGTPLTNVSQDILDRYVAGNASLEEIVLVAKKMKEDNEFASLVSLLGGLYETGSLGDNDIPMASIAAVSKGNLCDVMCEQYILKDYLPEGENPSCIEDALDNYWLTESGTPLHNMGRLLEKYGMSVARRYDCTVEMIASSLDNRDKVIAVVDYGQLLSGESDGNFHAVVCISTADDVIRIYDPAKDGHSNCDINVFEKAWAYSGHYLVSASASHLEYIPHPIDVNDVTLSESLLELSEAIAENAHEIWAAKRREEGWSYGPLRNEALKQHPDMVPYAELSENEKSYDRIMAINTIRLVKRLGFSIRRRDTLYCPHCGEYVSDTMHYCPNCGGKLTV